MRVLFCIKAMNNPGGGAERVLAEVANGLVARGYEVGLLTFDAPGGCSFYELDKGIKRIELGIGSTISAATLPVTIRRIRALRVQVKTYTPDVVIGFMHSMFILLGFALLGTSVPLIASEHIVPEHYKTRPLEALLLYFTPFLVDRITCVSEQVRDLYNPFIARKMWVIPNPVSLTISKRADIFGQHGTRKILLAVGRLDAQKDYETLIKAFSLVAEKFPDWDLRIVGEGPMKHELQDLVQKIGLKGRVFFAGVTRNISTEYLSAQLFVQASRYESFSLTTVEALFHGLPAVGFEDCPGVNQFIVHGRNGFLAKGKGDRAANLANVLMPIMRDEALRANLAQHSDDTLEKYQLPTVLDQWEEIIHSVTNVKVNNDF